MNWFGWGDLAEFIRQNYVWLCCYKSPAAAPVALFTKADLSPPAKAGPLDRKGDTGDPDYGPRKNPMLPVKRRGPI